MLFKLALRNLSRKRWRTRLTVGGIAAAVASLIFMLSFINAFYDQMIRGATALETGALQIHTRAYIDDPQPRYAFRASEALLDDLRSLDAVAGASPRVYSYGLVGNEKRSQSARIIGIDVAHESSVTLVSTGVIEGTWLTDNPAEFPAAREVVLGFRLAQQLGVEVGDELALFLQEVSGMSTDDLIVVTGIVRTGSTLIDRTSLYMHLADLQYDMGLESDVHEIALSVPQGVDVSAVQQTIVERIEGITLPDADAQADEDSCAAISGDADPEAGALIVRTWKEIASDLSNTVEASEGGVWVLYFFLYAIAAFGLFNTQRMSALERTREFGVLLALGLSPRVLFGIIVVETVAMTVLGGLIGVAIGAGIGFYFGVAGLNMAVFTDQGGDFSYMGVAFDERLYLVVTASSVIAPLGMIVIVSLFCGLWPGFIAARLNAIQAISGRR